MPSENQPARAMPTLGARLVEVWRDYQYAQRRLVERQRPWMATTALRWKHTRRGWELVGDVMPPQAPTENT